jgi:hypothetical protein
MIRTGTHDSTARTDGARRSAPRRRDVIPSELRAKLYQWIKRRRPGIVVGPPGVGKTFGAKKEALRAKAERLIGDFEIVTGCKDLSPDHLFEARLVVTDDAEKYVRLIPSMIRKHCGGFDLRLVPWGDGSAVPVSGHKLVVLGLDDAGALHFRIFDAAGQLVIDADQRGLAAQAEAISALKQRLAGLWPPRVPTAAEKAGILDDLSPIVGHPHLGSWLRRVSEWDAEAALQSWPDEAWLLIIFDEAGRANSTLIDAILPLLNDFQVTIEGETYYCPTTMILLSNPAGMDSTSSAFTHALTSRLYERITMRQPGVAELARTYTLPEVRREVKRLGLSPRSCPDDRAVMLGCGLITALWGLPTDRRGAASLSDEARDFVERLGAADGVLAGYLTEVGELQHYGPDPRKGKRLMIAAAERADAEGVPFDDGHLIDSAVETLSIGGKPNFSEGQEPHSQTRLEDLIHLVAERIIRSPRLRQIILDQQDRGPEPDDPAAVAERAAAGLGTGGDPWRAWLERALREHDRRLVADDVADREARRALFAEFLHRVARMDAGLPAPELAHRIRELASRPDSQVIGDDGFRARADRELIMKLVARNDLSAPGAAIAAALAGPDGQLLPLDLDEEVRLAGREHEAAAPYEREIAEALRRSPQYRGRAPEVAGVLAAVYDRPAGSDVKVVLDLLWRLFPPTDPDSLAGTRDLSRHLFASTAQVTRPPYRADLERLALAMEVTA